MSVGSGGSGTVYSRLPQSTSDVETSEDEVSQHENLIFYRKIGTPKKGNMKEEEQDKSAMKDYQPLNHEGGSAESHEVQINGFSNINYSYPHGTGGTGIEEETMVMGPIGTSGSSSTKKEGGARHGNLQMLVGNQHPMSMMRQVAFVMSLCLCIFVIVAFLWVLPCNWSTCPIMHDRQTGSSWERTLRHLELIGRISVVPSGNEEHHNLLFMFRGEITVPDRDKEQETTEFSKPIQVTPKKEVPTPVPASNGGLVVLMGSTGTVVWYKTLHSVPKDINCNLTDFNKDGRTDCLLIGSNDLMCAFDPVSANILWFLQVDRRDKYIPSDMDFPLMLPDLNGDDVLDIAVTCRLASRSKNFTDKPAHDKIAVISGKTGKLFGSYFVDPACHSVYRLNLDNKFFVTYRCVDNMGIETVKEIDVMSLYANVSGYRSFFTLENLRKISTMPKQHYSANNGPPEPIKATEEPSLQPGKPASYSVLQRKLVVTNQGHCPEDCTASAVVYEKPNKTVWSDGGKKMYALRPGILMFTSHATKYSSENRNTQAGSVSGFAVKFWHWTACDKSSIWSSQQRRHKRMIKDTEWAPKSQYRDPWHEDTPDPNAKPTEFIESRESRIGVSGINTTTKSLSSNSSTVTTTYHPKDGYNTVCLKERIVLVTFNDTDMHLVNASESEIKQICASYGSGCQPSLAYQEQSLIIADLDGDGSKELVSYLTTYETEDDGVPGSDRLTLLSKVRVVRLEAELPKLYEAVTHL